MSSGPERGLRILITNRVLAHRTGTEVYVRDLSLALLERGHLPIVYSTHLGALAADIRSATIPVVADLSAIGEPPDVIHGHHGLELYTDVIAEHRMMVDDPAAEGRAAAVYLQSLAPRLHERDLLRAAFARMLRLPVVGRLIRNRAGREFHSHWFPELLRSMDRD